ncbi:MAG: asparagine synthase (glutamine-hydrolyzing) [Pirellulales bacterium]|nr:asparagine synthase (glutamine-hydrolyzing) [Pirellulales bacterium]
MCGICGVFGRPDRPTAEAMLSRLVHRGPDDGQVIAGLHFTLGARRLSILDVEHGRQPVANEYETIWAAQNGELYNYQDVRADLLAQGHRLLTKCDTEVLPHLWEEHGTDLVSEIDGMFAVAVWDEQARIGLLARDRMGKKPLYYVQQGDSLYFASEIKALLMIPGFSPRINLQALHHYLSLKHVPHPLSIFEGIRILPPAHRLIYRPGRPLRIERYWELSFEPDLAMEDAAEEELVDELLSLLRDGVRRRLRADVPIGFFLSGGVDSALSTVLAAELSSQAIKTFTLGYQADSSTENKQTDSYWARWVSERYKTEHHELALSFDDFPQRLPAIAAAFDEPFSGVVSTYFLAELISQHVKVALAGDGADELFGSYLTHRLAQPLANWEEYRRTKNKDLIRPFQDQVPFLKRLAAEEDWEWRSKLFVFSEEEKRALYSNEIRTALEGTSTAGWLRRDFEMHAGGGPLNRILGVEFRTLLPDQVLTFVDRLSMAHSLEVRSAFLDTKLVEFVARLPDCWKIRNGETKYLLKQAAARYLPREMVFRPKEGFVLPINNWLTSALREFTRAELHPNRLAEHGLFNPVYVTELLNEFHAGQTQKANQVLALLHFQAWHRQFRSARLAA